MTLRTGGTLLTPPAGSGGGGGGTDPGALQKAANLGDVPNKPAARGNMGLGTAATHDANDFDLTGDGAAASAAAQATAIATAQAYADANKAQRLIPTAVKTSANNPVAAVNGQLVPCDASAASFTVNLPNAPAAGTTVGVLLVATAAGHTVTVAAAGADVIDRAGTTTLQLQLLSSLKILTYTAGTWYSAGGNLSLSQLDGRFDALGAAAGVQTDVTSRWQIAFGATRRTMPPNYDEIAAVGFVNIDTFVAWLTQAGVVLGCVGEVGIPNQNMNVDTLNPYTQEPIGVTRGSTGPHNVETGRWAAALETIFRYINDQSTSAQPNGLAVLGWEGRETSQAALNMVGPDITVGGAAPLQLVHPAGRVLIEHINRQQTIGVDALAGLAVSTGMDGLSDTSVLTRGADTTAFSTATPGPALGTSYCYGRPQTFQNLSKLGIRFVRLLFRGERLFNDDGTLDPVELARFDDAIAAAQAAGVFVILDWHGGASRYFDNGLGNGGLVRRSMGQADGTTAQPLVFDQTYFALVWGRLVSHYMTAQGAADPNNVGITGRGDLKSAIVGYELMNEPAIYPPGSTNAIVSPDMSGRNIWQNFSIGAAWTIRGIDPNTPLFIQAYGGGSSAPSFWTYHVQAGGAPNHWITLPASMGGGADPKVYYVMHTYLDSAGSGVYPDTYELTRSARAAQGYSAKPNARPLGGLMLPHGGHWPRTMVTGLSGVPALANNVLTSDVYKCPANRMAILTDVVFTTPAGGTLRIFARPTGLTNPAAVNAAWERARYNMANAPTVKCGPIFLGPDDRLDALASVAGVTMSFTLYELPLGNGLKVVSGLALPAGDNLLYQASTQIPTVTAVTTKARVCSAGAIFHPMGHGWAAFNGAAVAVNCQGKIQKGGVGAIAACGPPLATPATFHALGPSNIAPGVPSNMVDVVLDANDKLFLNTDQAGVNVWLLIQELV
jgi:hypothetical protein